MRRALVIVPGRAGFQIDATHRVMVDRVTLERPDTVTGTGFKLRQLRYFPGNARWIGDWFVHHELQALFERID